MKGGREGGTEGRKRGRGKKEEKKKEKREKSPDYSIFQFLWCKYSHGVDFKPTNDLLTSLQNSWIFKNWLSQTWRNHLLYTQLSLRHGHVRSLLPALEDEIAAHEHSWPGSSRPRRQPRQAARGTFLPQTWYRSLTGEEGEKDRRTPCSLSSGKLFFTRGCEVGSCQTWHSLTDWQNLEFFFGPTKFFTVR